MKKLLSSILFMLFVIQVSAGSFYDQLCQFNSNWTAYESMAPEGDARHFQSDQAYIQAHLSSVLTILQKGPTQPLSIEQYTSRLHLITVLDGYRLAGNFPINYYRQERVPVFIDEHDTHCAVGYLLQQTGHQMVARRIAAADNYIWVKDIQNEDLFAWQQSSGFSLDELKLIQGAYEFYIPNAQFLANRFEIPQKPVASTRYFKNKTSDQNPKSKTQRIWFKGEGKNGILNGKWEQNYDAGIPWIEGYFSNGKRTGQWKEYYQGTAKLCRTENWRNDKLNGIRKRFDRSGILIEEIMFKNGKAVSKTNYDHDVDLTYVRKPLDSTLMYTEVYTPGGRLLAAGHERIYNPGNLSWFQDIELTALNSFSVKSRDMPMGQKSNLYNPPPLVQYKKEGDWVYFKESYSANPSKKSAPSLQRKLSQDYPHFGSTLYQSIHLFDQVKVTTGYDSIRVVYNDDRLEHFQGYGDQDYVHLKIQYHQIPMLNILQYNHISVRRNRMPRQELTPQYRIKELGQFNQDDEKINVWKHFDTHGRLYKTEKYIARKEGELLGLGIW